MFIKLSESAFRQFLCMHDFANLHSPAVRHTESSSFYTSTHLLQIGATVA